MGKKIELSKPPVIEVVIGAQFEGPVFDNTIIYNFYQKVKSDFPKIQENPPLPSIIANPSKPNQTRILQGFNSRRFFINANGEKLIQLQSDRLLFNWRKNSETDEYPKFKSVLDEFLKVYSSILQEANNAPEKLNQLEITFIDHINLKDFELQTYKMTDIFNNFTLPYDLSNFECNFTIPKETINGNLTLVIKSGINNKDQKRLLVCESTCRGSLLNSESITDWYNRSHSILLEFFIDLFTEKSKTIWGVKK